MTAELSTEARAYFGEAGKRGIQIRKQAIRNKVDADLPNLSDPEQAAVADVIWRQVQATNARRRAFHKALRYTRPTA